MNSMFDFFLCAPIGTKVGLCCFAEDSLRESLWKLFVDFKEKGRLLKVQIDGEHEARYALLTFQKPVHVEKALEFATMKTLNGIRLKAERYDGATNGTEEK